MGSQRPYSIFWAFLGSFSPPQVAKFTCNNDISLLAPPFHWHDTPSILSRIGLPVTIGGLSSDAQLHAKFSGPPPFPVFSFLPFFGLPLFIGDKRKPPRDGLRMVVSFPPSAGVDGLRSPLFLETSRRETPKSGVQHGFQPNLSDLTRQLLTFYPPSALPWPRPGVPASHLFLTSLSPTDRFFQDNNEGSGVPFGLLF